VIKVTIEVGDAAALISNLLSGISQLKERITMKYDELATTLTAMKAEEDASRAAILAQLTTQSQQITDLQAQLANVDVPQAAVDTLAALKTSIDATAVLVAPAPAPVPVAG
jgi:hypothetical protein